MKLTFTVEINEDVIGDDLRYPVIAEMLIQCAGDIMLTRADSQMLGKRVGYGAHNIAVGKPVHGEPEVFPPPDVRSRELYDGLAEWLREREATSV